MTEKNWKEKEKRARMNWKASTVLFLASQCISSLSDFLFERKIQEMAFCGGNTPHIIMEGGDGRECVWYCPLWPENLRSVLGLTSVCRLCVSRWEHLPTTLKISLLLGHVPCSTRECCCTSREEQDLLCTQLSVKNAALASCQRAWGSWFCVQAGGSGLEAGWELLSWGGTGAEAFQLPCWWRGAEGCPWRLALGECL